MTAEVAAAAAAVEALGELGPGAWLGGGRGGSGASPEGAAAVAAVRGAARALGALLGAHLPPAAGAEVDALDYAALDRQTRALLEGVAATLRRTEGLPTRALLERAPGAGSGGEEEAGDASASASEGAEEEGPEEGARRARGTKRVRFAADALGEEAAEDASSGSDDGLEGDEDWEQEMGPLRHVEDAHLRFAEMEKFVRQAEALEEREQAEEDEEEDDDDSDDGGLLFGGGAEDGLDEDALDELYGADEDGDEDEDEEAKEMTASDFFKPDTDRGPRPKRKKGAQRSGAEDGGGAPAPDAEVEGGWPAEEEEEAPATVHGVRTKRLKERIRKLEEKNMQEKHWSMKGEVQGADRPLNSLLELDVDFEHAMRAAPVITEEVTMDLEQLIVARIKEGRFDDPVKVVEDQLAKDGKPMTEEELDDRKSKKGLGDLYEADYMKAAGAAGASDEKEALRGECWHLFRQINAHLDALSHFDFTPVPVEAGEPPKAATDAPALALEEVGADAGTAAGTKAPEEVLANKGAAPKAKGEYTHGERRARRRARKRQTKNVKKAQKDGAAVATGTSKGEVVDEEAKVAGRKSLEEDKRARKRAKGSAAKKERAVRFGKSAEVFGKLQEMRENGGGGKAKRKEGGETKGSKSFKL